MGPRKVIADSEDEDDGDDILLIQPACDSDRPEPEPLSPHGRPSRPATPKGSNQPADDTGSSFFTNIFNDQQGLAAQQSHLIETIVRQSQRASAASSGDVFAPTKSKGRRGVNLSSGTDVTSPVVLSRPRNHNMLLSDEESEFTTPHKSREQVWEIPSSPADDQVPNNTKRLRRHGTTDDSTERGDSGALSASTTAEAYTAGDMTRAVRFEGIGSADQEASIMDSAPLPMPGRTNSTHYDSALPDTSSFYIAQSNLTTMQKLQYQKVSVTTNSFAKSSGATTIQYSTPRGYSSIPPPPWEELDEQPSSPPKGDVLSITSSPDVIGSGFDAKDDKSASDKNRTSLATPKGRTPISKARKRPAQDLEEDELSRDDALGLDDLDVFKEHYRPRTTKRRSITATDSVRKSAHDITADETVIPIEVSEVPAQSSPNLNSPEPPPEKQPKKRGRKKKQPPAEPSLPETVVNEDIHPDQDPAPIDTPIDTEPLLSKPKKKRGRPRKTEPLKAAAPPSPEPPVADSPRSELDVAAEEAQGNELDDTRPPFQAVDNNTTTPTKLSPEMDAPLKTFTGPDDEKPTSKVKARETPKTTASQPKAVYRVGLSKRSRIAPLLKSIKK